MRSIVYMSLFSCSTLVRSILVIIPVVRWCSLTGPHQWGVGSRASLGRTKWDLSIVSDLKTVRMPWCCRQRRRKFENTLYVRENSSRFKFLRSFFVGCYSCFLCEFSHKRRRITIRNKCWLSPQKITQVTERTIRTHAVIFINFRW